MLNQVTLIGHLGADPEIHRTQDGRAIATFSVATSERWTDKGSGEKKERTEWHRIVIFSEGLAGVAEKYLSKGHRVYLQGQLQTRKWTDQKEIERYTTEVVLRGYDAKLVLLTPQSGGSRPPAPSAEDAERAGATAPRAAGSSGRAAAARGGADMDDEIPF